MQRIQWIERKFNLDLPPGLLPAILERLRGTAIRIKYMTSGLSDEQAKQRHNNTWSIKEHIGHLADLEALHEGRIDDFLARKEILRAADMKNKETNTANHNDKSIDQLLNNFIHKRNTFISRLEKLDDETQQVKSLHPRLQVIMRPVDMAYFTAEHDDHHLASIREVLSFKM